MAEADPSMTSTPMTPTQAQEDVQDDSYSPSYEPSIEQPQARTYGGFLVDDDDNEDSAQAPKMAEPETSGSSNIDPKSPMNQTSVDHSFLPAATDQNVSSVDFSSSVIAQEGKSETVGEGNTDVPSIVDALPSQNGGDDVGVPQIERPPSVRAQSKSPVIESAEKSPISSPKARLPYDRIGLLEDRIAEDPKGDLDAWLTLISEHKNKNNADKLRDAYERFLQVFPTATDQWTAYVQFELQNDNFYKAEAIFNKSVTNIPNVDLWTTYLNYVRRRYDLTKDTSGQSRQIITQAFDIALNHVGQDKDSGKLWQEYLQFLKSGAGQVGGNSWQDQQKMDVLRKAYQRAICVPTQSVQPLWKEYDNFEIGLNRMAGRKILQEKSASYVTARTAYTALQNMTRGLDRYALPKLPPAPGCQGHEEFLQQVQIWKKWLDWEKNDPLELKDDEPKAYRDRVLYVYRQAVQPMRFWPDFFAEGALFCYDNKIDQEGDKLLKEGVSANPENPLLALFQADRIENTTTSNGQGDEGIVRRGAEVRTPYEQVHDALYDLLNRARQRETKEKNQINEAYENEEYTPAGIQNDFDVDDDEQEQKAKQRDAEKKAALEAVNTNVTEEVKYLSRVISFVWVALLRAMRRVQGQGKTKGTVGGTRQVVTDARKRGRITSDFYLLAGLLDYHCFETPKSQQSGSDNNKSGVLLDRGNRLFPDDEEFTLDYLKHLISVNDHTNARVVYSKSYEKMKEKPEWVPKARPILYCWHEYEARYGDLEQVKQVEARIMELYPDESKLSLFARRHAGRGFDICAVKPIVSHGAQKKPKVVSSIEHAAAANVHNSPVQDAASTLKRSISPKRSREESDNEYQPPRKLPRADSPLKGAAGRRMDAARRSGLRNEARSNGANSSTPSHVARPVAPPSLPGSLMHLLGIIPRSSAYNGMKFNPERMTDLVRNMDMGRATYVGPQQQNTAPAPPPYPQHMSVPPAMSMQPQMAPYTPAPPYGYSQPAGHVPYGYPR